MGLAEDRDLLDLYIDELRGEPVLSAEEQKALARVMRGECPLRVADDVHRGAVEQAVQAGADRRGILGEEDLQGYVAAGHA